MTGTDRRGAPKIRIGITPSPGPLPARHGGRSSLKRDRYLCRTSSSWNDPMTGARDAPGRFRPLPSSGKLTDRLDAMHSYNLTFDNGAGHLLAARLDLPVNGEPVAYALFAHCFTCSKNLHAVGHIAEALTLGGIGVLRFDFTGLGQSAGEFAETNFTTNVDDLVAAARFMEEHGRAPAILIGHSLGGAAMLQATARIPSALAVATIGAPAEPSHILKLLDEAGEAAREQGEATLTLGGKRFTIRRQLIENLEAGRMHDAVGALGRPLLVLHSPVDEVVGIENAARIFEAARHPKSFISLDNADHLLTRAEDSCYVGDMIAAWSRRYLKLADATARTPVAVPERVVVRNDVGSLRAQVMAGHHGFVVDEPLASGGTDQGPTPYDLLCASLGACTAITLRLYADRKKWNLTSVIVRLKHEKIHATDCVECESPSAKIDHIDREIELVGELDDQQRARLIEIAEHCPVHKTMNIGFRITTHVAPRAEGATTAAAMEGTPIVATASAD